MTSLYFTEKCKYIWSKIIKHWNINMSVYTLYSAQSQAGVGSFPSLSIFYISPRGVSYGRQAGVSRWHHGALPGRNSDTLWSSVKIGIVVVVGDGGWLRVQVYSVLYSYHHHYLCPVIISLCQSGLIRARSWVWSSLLTCSQSVLPDSVAAGVCGAQSSTLTYIFTFFYWLDVHQLSAASVFQSQWQVREIQDYIATPLQ